MHRITLIPGDGIGPEVTQSAREVVTAAGVNATWETVGAGMPTASSTRFRQCCATRSMSRATSAAAPALAG